MLALARHLPRLAANIPRVALGEWPTPIRTIGGLQLGRHSPSITGYAKDEGVSSSRYGGNKVRTLEVWLGLARRRGARRIWAIGAYGSNHVIATVRHAAASGLDAGAIVFPQPTSSWAIENCRALIASGCPIVRLHNVAEVPFAALAIAIRDRGSIVMPPGGATPLGALGAAGAAFELAEQIEAQLLPPPTRIVVAAGSGCTTAGLMAGIALAEAIKLWRWPVPTIHAVRVTPWPVTSRARLAHLAHRTLAIAHRLGGPDVAVEHRALVGRLHVDPHQLGRGYGRVTAIAQRTIGELPAVPRLDGVYSAKAAAAWLDLLATREPILLWATKAATELAPASEAQLAAADQVLREWLGR